MKNKNIIEEEVYTTTGLSDLLSSPVFYSVLVLTFILGLSSIFGFLEDPLRLKIVVDSISERVSINEKAVVFYDDEYSSYRSSQGTVSFIASSRYDILSKELFSQNSDMLLEQDSQKVSFNYDITSKQFWESLDSSRIESASEESNREKAEALRIGAPLSTDYYSEQGDEKYSLAAGLLRL